MLNTVDLTLTRRCNLRCSFCYMVKKNEESEDEIERNLFFCNWIVEQFRKEMSNKPVEYRRVGINLYGGEPTVAWDSVQALVEWAKTIKDIQIQFSLVTNMVLMDEEKINYCIANRIGIHPSIDGCQEAEDMFRKTIDGRDVSDEVFKNAKILNSKLKGRSCRSTVAPETVPYMFKSIKFLCEDLGFQTVNQVLAGGVKWTNEDIKEIENQLKQITDWWIDKMREDKHYSIYYLRNMFMGIWTPLRARRLCSSGLSRGAIDTDGNIYPCHRFCNEDTPKEYLMGNVYKEGVVNEELKKKLMDFDMPSYHKEKCANCIAVNSCHALCLHEMMLQGKGMFEPLEHYCKIWPIYYREAMRAHAILTAERNKLYQQVYQPKIRR